MEQSPSSNIALRIGEARDGVFTLVIEGRLDSRNTGRIWRQANEAVTRAGSRKVVLDAAGVEYCDGTGIALLARLRQRQQQAGGILDIRGLRPEFQQHLDAWQPEELQRFEPRPKPRISAVEGIGKSVVELWNDTRSLIGFVGELTVALAMAVLRPHRVRWGEMLRIAEAVGVNALPLVALVGFLMGLIMAFQAAIPLGRFGAQVFVANLIGLSILREIGPLMTAIVLAGRSGSAFAAELGTMKVREEIDALITMGLDPIRFLVVTRVIAAVLMVPLLTIFADLIGVLGGSLVLVSLGFSSNTILTQMQTTVTYVDFLGGLIKSFVFGILVAGIGCLRGLETTTGARAVGEATTSAVVSGIVLIVLADGGFSIIYYYLEI